MVEQDNSIPFITADKNPKPAKVRKFKTLLLHGFDGNAVYALIPFVNVRSIVFVMQDISRQLTWVTELVKALEKEGIYINSEYRDTQKVNGQLVLGRYNIHYPLPEQLFNVK